MRSQPDTPRSEKGGGTQPPATPGGRPLRFHPANALRSAFVSLGRHLRHGAAAYAVLLISLLLTALASWYYVRQSVDAQNQAQFNATVLATRAAVDRRVNAYLDAMVGVRGLFFVSDSVGRAEWESYVRNISPEDRLKGFLALGFSERVRTEEADAYSKEARREGQRALWPEPNGERSVLFPLRFVSPSNEANRTRTNFDAYADPEHKSAMDRARDTGLPQATETVYVLANAPEGHSADLVFVEGFVVYLPVYQEGAPQGTVAERRRSLRGFVTGVMRTEELFADAFSVNYDPTIDFEVYEGRTARSSPPLYDDNGVWSVGGFEPDLSKHSRIKVAGREFILYFATLPGYEGSDSNVPTFVLLSGVAVSFLLFGISWMLVRSRGQAVRASADLEEANIQLENANTELQSSRESLVSTREEERRRLRRDLHDGVGPQLAALMLGLETASDLVSDDPVASTLMTRLSEHARETVRDVRRSVHALRPPALDELGLVGALREGALQYGSRSLHVSIEVPEELPPLPAAVEVACYRITQEAITNVARHAQANRCRVRLGLDEEVKALYVEVEDDGMGLRNDSRAGVGMISMRERAEELGGTLTVKSRPRGGTLVRAVLPCAVSDAKPGEGD